MLRRTKTIVFDDDPNPTDNSFSGSEPASLRAGRRNLDLRSGVARPSPRFTPREVEFDDTPEPVANPVHERMDFLRSELDQSPISKGSQESLAALRAEFRRKHIESADDPVPRSLPSFSFGGLKLSRILLLLVALVAGGVAAFLAVGRNAEPAAQAATEIVAPTVVAAPTVQVLVAKSIISIGQRLSPETVEWQSWPEASARPEFITADATPEAITDMAGAVARFEFFAGEPIRKEKLTETGAGFLSAILSSGMRGVSVSVEAASASGGFIVPNDRVDVVLTQDDGTVSSSSKTILSNVRVLAINANLGDAAKLDGTADEVFADAAIATLELDPTQAEMIINATTLGKLSLMLRPILDFAETGKPEQRATNQAIRISSPFWMK